MNKRIKNVISLSLLILVTLKSTVFAINPSRELFESAKSIGELLLTYREMSSNNSLSDDELLDLARQDWYEIALQETENGQSFDRLPAEVVIVDGVEYRLYGYTHGVPMPFHTMSKEYRYFVQEAYRIENDRISIANSNELGEALYRSTFITAEEGLLEHAINDEYIIDIKDHPRKSIEKDLIVDPDPIEKIEKDLIVGLLSGIFIIPSLFVYYSSSFTDTTDDMGILQDFRESLFNRTNDSMEIEIQQGLKKRLPSHLEMEFLLLKTQESKLDETSRSERTTRSLYMAGFLKGFAEKGKYKEVPFFMGSGHLSEVKGFLIDTNGYAQQTGAYNRGKEKGSLIAENLIEAQKSQNTDELLDTINMWNPKKAPSTLLEAVTFSETRIENQSPMFYLGLLSVLTAQAYLIYYGCTKILDEY